MARHCKLIFSLVLMVLGALAMTAPAHAALGLRETPDQTWMANGNVYAQALSEDGETLYIGGKFKQVRQKPSGQGGTFLAVNNVAAIDVDTGAAISSWRPSVTSSDSAAEVRSLAVKNGRVYIGGRFNSVAGQPRRNLAAVDAVSGNAVPSFDPVVGTANSMVYALAVDANRLYVGGTFPTVDGTSRGNLAAIGLTSGTLDPAWNARTNKLVRDLEFDPTGTTIFAMGGFGGDAAVKKNNVSYKRQSVARFDVATGAVHPWTPPDGTIQLDSGRNNSMTCWNATATATRLYLNCGLGPNFTVAVRLDNGTSGDRVWQTGFVGNPVSSAFSPDGSRLLIGGHFGINPLDQVCNGRYLKGLAALNPVNGAIDCSWVPTLDQKSRPDYDGAWSLLTANNRVWVGGGFTGVSGVPQTNLARFTYDPSFRPFNYSVPKVDLNGPESGSGLRRGGLNAVYYDNMDFTGAEVSRVDPTINFNFGNGSPDPSMGPDEFSARWTGQVEAPVSGEYTFTTNADDGVRLFIDGQQIIDAWRDRAPEDDSGTVTLEAGQRYDIRLDYYERGGGAVARLDWAYPGQARQTIPSANLIYSGDSNGLDVTYFDNMDFTGTQVSRVDQTVNFDFGNGSPDPSIGPDTFSARWTGQVEAPVSGEYTFITTADDGVRLFVDGRQIVDNWTDRAPTDDTGSITLEAGRRYDIQMDYYENGVGAVARLQWAYPGQTRQVIPAANLRNFGNTGFAAAFTPGAGPTPIVDTSNLSVFDADDVNIRSATVTLQDRPNGAAERLLADTTGTAVTQNYDAATGTLSLNGTATKAVYERILKSVRYDNTSASPTAGDRRVTFVINDGFVNSAPATSTVTVQGP